MQPEEQTALALDVAGRLGDLVPVARLADRDRAKSEAQIVALIALAEQASPDAASFVAGLGVAASGLASGGDAAVVGSGIAVILADLVPADSFGAAVAAVLAGAYCACLIKGNYPAQPDAAAARDIVKAMVNRIGERLGNALGFKVAEAFEVMTGQTAVELSRIAASRAPLVRVETGISLPSTLLAWELYQDPDRAGELVGRNRVSTPQLMPIAIEALSR
jgi:hypothetical protein